MKMSELGVGAKVTVLRRSESSWLVPLIKRGGKLVHEVGAWYPYGQSGEIVKVMDCWVTLKMDNGKEWPHPFIFYNLKLR